MNPGFLDHGIAFALVVLLPVVSYWRSSRAPENAQTSPEARRREYRNTIAMEWSLVAIVLGVWFALGRDRAGIGVDVPGGIPTIIGLAITLALVVALCLQIVAVRRGGEAARAAVRAQMGSFQPYAPRTRSDARWFHAVSVTAGICEEVLYRGFLIAYLGATFGVWPAVVVAAAVFGVVHLHLGRAHAVKATVVGLIAGILYIGCGTLLWPMLVHMALDLHGGTLARLALEEPA